MLSNMIKKSKSLFRIFSHRNDRIHQLEIIENKIDKPLIRTFEEVIESSISLYTEVYADLIESEPVQNTTFKFLGDQFVTLKINYKNNFELIEKSESKILWLTRNMNKTLVIAHDSQSSLLIENFNSLPLSSTNGHIMRNLFPNVDLLTMKNEYSSETDFNSKKIDEILKLYQLVILISK
jgi:hypothetical protein